MKKVNLLSKAEMKKVMGGNELPGEFGSCTVTVTCSTGSVSCTSQNGKCWKGQASVQCDDDKAIIC